MPSNSQRGRGRGRGREANTTRTSTRNRNSIPAPTLHVNGAAEIAFQANIVTPSNSNCVPSGEAADTLRHGPTALTIVEEEPVIQVQIHRNPPGTAPPAHDDDDNPFLSPAPTAVNVHFDLPSSPGAESFASPSPTQSELDEEQGHRANMTPNRRTPQTTRAVRVVAHTHGTPRAGRHSPLRAQHREQHQVNHAKKLKARDVWSFFKKDERGQHACLFCKQKQAVDPLFSVQTYGPKTGTTVLRSHLCNEHLGPWVEGCDKFKIPIVAKTFQGRIDEYRNQNGGGQEREDPTLPTRAYSREAFVDAIVEWIVADDQSLNVVESPELRSLFRMLREDLRDSDIPGRTHIRTRVAEVWDEHMAKLEEEMTSSLGKISMTMDLWTDANLSPFMAVTAHWIEVDTVPTLQGTQYNLRLRADLIGFHHVPGHHSGEHIAHAFLHVLDRIGVAHKLGWITLDNASNNDTFMSKLEEELRKRGIPFDHIENRIRCFPHVVNLACKAILAALTDLNYAREPTTAEEQVSFLDAVDKDPIATIRALIRVIRASSIRRQQFSQIVKTFMGKDLQLLRDVDTRWSSALLMIERALILERCLESFLNIPEFHNLRDKYHLTDEEWNALSVAREILLIPFAFQQRLSAQKTPTLCDAIPSFEAMIRTWKEMQLEFFGGPEYDVIDKGLDKLSVYLERAELVPAYVISMVLNPSIKLRHYAEHAPEKLQWAKETLRDALLPYHGKRTQASQTTAQSPPPASQPIPVQGPAPVNPLASSHFTPLRSRANRNGRAAVPSRTADEILGFTRPTATRTLENGLDDEIESYLLDTNIGTSSLMFWQENQLRYPTLFLAALDYLPIQGSAVPCERVFSSAKETMTDRRNRICEKLMEQLQMLKFSFKNGRHLDFSMGTSEKDILEYLEAMAGSPDNVSEDLHAFIQSLGS